jgi:RNA polymerase sigma-70 factor (ECF subfamily)
MAESRYDGLVSGWQTTRESLIAAAASDARAAMAELCKAYWLPVYTFVRRSGHSPHDAQDLVQSFFTRVLLERNDLASFDPRLGRFRNWLLVALKHFLANESRRGRTVKRGGRTVVVSIDDAFAEERYANEPVDLLTPERLYERRWALTVLERVMGRLAQEYARRDRRERFEHLRGFLVGDEPSYKALAEELGEAEGTLRAQVKRMRDRYRELLHAEIKDTVPRSDDVENERRYLCAALS